MRRGSLPLVPRVALTLVLAWLAVDLGLPRIAMWLGPASRPVPLPGFARALYLLLTIAGGLVYLSASEASMGEVSRAVDWLVRGPVRGAGAHARRVVLVLLPVAVGVLVWQATRPREATPTALRTQHPTLPQAFESLRNPLREADDRTRAASTSTGREMFQVACRPCHGAAGDGRGPMARGFRLRPADFTDPGTLASVVEAYAFWRVSEGGVGLPAEGTPWDSAMPAWKHALSERERWTVLLGAYDVARVEARRPEGSTTPTGPPASTTAAAAGGEGEQIYLARCAPCHGARGDGKGPVAPYVDPEPRDFTAGVFELRTTESGQPPTDDDLLRVVTNGVPGTAMPAWGGALSERERRLVVEHVKRFTESFRTAPTVVRPAKTLAASATVVARGREVYDRAKCWECHGAAGRGDGPSAATLKDDAGDPITPADLTKGWRLKGGHEASDIFMRLSTGMDGTPMPSYADTLPEEDRWALAHYVRSLQRHGEAGLVLRAPHVAGDVPRAPDDPRWRLATPVTMPLAGQVIVAPRWQNHGIDEVLARAVFSDRDVAVLLEWNDATRNMGRAAGDGAESDAVGAPKLGQFGYVLAEERTRDLPLPDGIRLQFARPGAERPHFLLGSRGRPVVLWHWRADRPGVATERAEGPEERPAALASAPVAGHAVWHDGRWQVVFVRRLAPADTAGDVAFTRGVLIPFAVHAWDGARAERELMMSLSSWTFLLLEPGPSVTAPLAAALAIGVTAAGEWWLSRRARRRPRAP